MAKDWINKMAISVESLERHIDDYHRTTGNRETRFICPITLTGCETERLIKGHIFNEQIIGGFNRTVIQYGDVDHFYGSRLEQSFVRFLNLAHGTENDLVRWADELKVRFNDGEEVAAFRADSSSATKAAGRFGRMPLYHKGRLLADVYVRVPADDPRLKEPGVQLVGSGTMFPVQWAGAMLKAGFLTMFDLLGYSFVFNPLVDPVRRALASYYNDRASRDDAVNYFWPYRYAMRVFVRPEGEEDGFPAGTSAFAHDSRRDRQFLLHHSAGRTIFAITCLYTVRRGTMAITLPWGDSRGDCVSAMRFYERVMEGDKDARRDEWVIRAQFRDGGFHQVESLTLDHDWTPRK